MSFRPSPKQALFLWKMIAGESPEVREPPKSKAKPALDPKKERQPLIDNGFLETERRRSGRTSADHLVLTDRAWAWAAGCADVEIMKSNSREGAVALQGLLRRLIPALDRHGIALGELFAADGGAVEAVTSSPTLLSPAEPTGAPERTSLPEPTKAPEAMRAPAVMRPPALEGSPGPDGLEARVLAACRDIAGGSREVPVQLSVLRARLGDVAAKELDAALHRLRETDRVALYRNDNAAAVTEEDARAALIVGDAPRHLLYVKE